MQGLSRRSASTTLRKSEASSTFGPATGGVRREEAGRPKCRTNVTDAGPDPFFGSSDAALAKIGIESWREALDRSGGPFLFGRFSIADAMFFPGCTPIAAL
jgi:hypothetical protein